jgi:nucleotide-binding universal stress UspA family protein
MSYHISKILVPVDLSETSLNALETCIALAKKHGANIIILNVIESKYSSREESDVFNVSSSLSNSKDVLNALIGSIEHAHDLTPRFIQKEGSVSEHIIRTSIVEEADLIVMGTHGASGYRDGFMGSNTYNVMKHVLCPVLSLPSKKKFSSFKKVVFPIRPVSGTLSRYDILCHFLSSQSSIDVLGMSYRKMERDTRLLEKIVEEIADKVEMDRVEINTAWGNGAGISEDILSYVQQASSDLIVVTSVLDVTTKNGFMGPHAQRIVNCSKIPVLSIKGIGVPYYA